MSHDSKDRNFIILTSHGRTATSWISNALNHHPDFCCSHSNLTFKYGERFEHRFNYDQVAPIPKSGKAAQLSLDEYFDLHLTVADVKNYASIHNYQLTSLENFLNGASPDRKYHIHNIIRHPIDRLRSYTKIITLRKPVRDKHWLHLFRTGKKHRAIANWIDEHFDVDFNEFSNVAFVCSLSTLLIEYEELQMDYPHYPMEKLVYDRDYFANWIHTISAGASRADDQFLDTVFSFEKSNQPFDDHKTGIQVFEGFEEWQRQIWLKYDNELDLAKMYEPYGYDLKRLR